MSKKIIIGITGTLGAGKGAVVDYLLGQKGFKHFSARALFTDEIINRGLPVNRDTMTEVANELRMIHMAHLMPQRNSTEEHLSRMEVS